jgi:hypothetical protein
MRASAEASVDPAVRVADMMERQQLAQSALDVSALVERARDMLDGGQPKRAALFLASAEDKGGSPAALGVRAAVERALDEVVPERARAMAIEKDVAASVADFRAARLRQLYDSRLGLRRVDGDGPGEVGSGRGDDLAMATLSAKVDAWVMAREADLPYSGPTARTNAERENTSGT